MAGPSWKFLKTVTVMRYDGKIGRGQRTKFCVERQGSLNDNLNSVPCLRQDDMTRSPGGAWLLAPTAVMTYRHLSTIFVATLRRLPPPDWLPHLPRLAQACPVPHIWGDTRGGFPPDIGCA